jgi:hypothetical protein
MTTDDVLLLLIVRFLHWATSSAPTAAPSSSGRRSTSHASAHHGALSCSQVRFLQWEALDHERAHGGAFTASNRMGARVVVGAGAGAGVSGPSPSPSAVKSRHDDIERCLGARLVRLLDFYGRAFDPRNMGVSVCRNRGEGEFLMRDHSSRVRVDLSQPSVALSQVHLAEL